LPCSLWCATLFRDDHTAVVAGNVLHGKNLIVGTENNFEFFAQAGLAVRLDDSKNTNLRAENNLFFSPKSWRARPQVRGVMVI
jgi:hypothetical protein